MMELVKAVLAEGDTLPPIRALGYEYVVAGNGLLIRAENDLMEAAVLVSAATLPGLPVVEPYARLRCERIPEKWLTTLLARAREVLPREVLFQFYRVDGQWRCVRPEQSATPTHISFEQDGAPGVVVDIHSHGFNAAFFSTTDNSDEQGLRFYGVMGKVSDRHPEIMLRVGVYGFHAPVKLTDIFDGPGPFVERQEWYEKE